MVIPAHPLALTARRRLDERHQRALTRYYLDAGAGGLAVGVHTTQFAIRSPSVGLYRPVLELAAETAARWHERRPASSRDRQPPILIAGITGPTRQALGEARLGADLGYHLGLVSLAALPHASNAALIAHVRAVAEVFPVMGFYLQPAVGGRPLDYAFWRELAEVDNVVAIKIAPFNRYDTLAVVRAVAASGRSREIALYTGNDDHIILDLVASYPVQGRRIGMVGGLLGQWACWTHTAVRHLRRCRRAVRRGSVSRRLLDVAARLTVANGAIFDAAHQYRGCIPGIHEVLRRQGLLRGIWCLDHRETLSPGQAAEIDRIGRAYPELNDDAFVARGLEQWLR